EYCDDEDEWGKTSTSCSSSYVSFGHDYTCTEARLSDLEDAGRFCQVDADGSLIISPCTGNSSSSSETISGADGACVFQPRVFAIDNWEWCTGECDSGDDGSEDCYGRTAECKPNDCPSGGYSSYACPDVAGSSVSDPWVYFDGYIVVDPS
ncbi:hypothetical protein HOI18_00565, partial [Candidatus Uhrbacteria bacterium]|nr:hypothetical protein [Candidatus Uhrbacteria bacterium]